MRRTALVRVVLASSFATLVLGACNRHPAGEVTPAPLAAAATVMPPAAASVATAARTATFKGYGEATFGMNSKELREAWKAPLSGQAPANLGDCYQLATDPAAPKSLTLMIEGDKLVRYDVNNDAEVAPGGGKRGMDIGQIRKLYAGRIREQPDKYVPGAVDLRVSADDDSGSALVFQTDAAGKVTSWRVGQPPAVDCVEGCS
jgi:hypothetical protein